MSEPLITIEYSEYKRLLKCENIFTLQLRRDTLNEIQGLRKVINNNKHLDVDVLIDQVTDALYEDIKRLESEQNE